MSTKTKAARWGARGAIALLAFALASSITALAWANDDSSMLQAGVVAQDGVAASSVSDTKSDKDSAPDVRVLAARYAAARGLGTQALASDGSGVTIYAGETMFETAIAQAKAAYPNGCETAILAGPGDAWVDALSAAGLAGSKGPILFTETNSLYPATLTALRELGVKKVIIVGGPAAVGNAVVGALDEQGIGLEKRLGGDDCYGTQLAIYEYGVQNNLWGSDMVILATGTWFGDALSVSPLAYAQRAPIFLVDNSLDLRAEHKAAWEAAARAGKGKTSVVVGGPAVVSQKAVDFADSMSKLAGGSGESKWLWGESQYETSTSIAEWAVESCGFSWNNVAFTTGYYPYDALAGSVLQGATKSVMLLADSARSDAVVTVAEHRDVINQVRFFGGDQVMPLHVRTAVTSALSDRVRQEATGISYAEMLALEVGKGLHTAAQLDASMNPSNWEYGDRGYYQFAALDRFTDMVTADQLDAYIATHGEGGMLVGCGQDFIDAARTYNVNEVYLLAHAILESGWGKSQLAMGTVIGGTRYHNFFGIGAYDSDAVVGGSSTAGRYGWNSPRATIMGSASWISRNYLVSSYRQNTLYKMNWNYVQAATSGDVWHQYATDCEWATKIANGMAECYAFCGLDARSSGLTYLVPDYS